MERVIIPKTDSMKMFAEPMPAWGRDRAGDLFLRCKCGLCMGMAKHSVAANGDVAPSLFHDDQKCGWHVFGTLADWDSTEGGSK